MPAPKLIIRHPVTGAVILDSSTLVLKEYAALDATTNTSIALPANVPTQSTDGAIVSVASRGQFAPRSKIENGRLYVEGQGGIAGRVDAIATLVYY